MKKIILILMAVVLGFNSCRQADKEESNLVYDISLDKPGPEIKEGDFIAFKVIQKTVEDSVMFNSWEDDRLSFISQSKPLFKDDLFAGLALLSEGDSATFKINLDSLALKMKVPKPANTKGDYMVYVLKIFKVIPKGNLDDKTFNNLIQNYISKENESIKLKEPAKIRSYISSRGLKPQTTSSGLKYIITKKGSGPIARPGDHVTLNYTASLLTGKIFESTYENIGKKANLGPNHPPYAPIVAIAGGQGTLPGYNEALTMFPAGSKVKLILPSGLAYGSGGTDMILPYTPIVFDIDFLSIKHSAQPQKGPVARIISP